MDQKQIKKTLLEAKDAIKNKDFKVAVRNCESILLYHADDYNALVFLGVALQEMGNLERALTSFQKAAKVSPSQILAWQGLQKYYEKEGVAERFSNLREVYLKLIEIVPDKDINKVANLLFKLGALYFEEKLLTDAEDCFTKALNLLESENLQSILSNKLWIHLVDVLISQTNLSSKQINILHSGLDKIYEGFQNKQPEMELWNYDSLDKYFNFMFRELLGVEKILHYIDKFLHVFEKNIAGFQKWKLRCFINDFILNGNSPDLKVVEAAVTVINEADKDGNALILFSKGIFSYSEKNFILSKEFFKKGMALNPLSCWESWLLMCWILECFRDGNSIEHYVREGLKLVSKKVVESKRSQIMELFYFTLGKGFFYQSLPSAFEKSIEQFLKISDSKLKSEALYYQGLDYTLLNRFDSASEIISSLEHSDSALHSGLSGIYYSKQNQLEKAKCSLQSALNSSYNHLYDDWLLELGSLYQLENKSEEALTYFIKASEVNPNYFKPHFFIGNYYKDVLNDMGKAEDSYKVAYSLRKYNEEIGICLSDIYYVNNKEEENFTLLREVTNFNAVGRCKWAWVRIGLLYLRQGAYLNSVRAFQSALTADPNAKECWECLAEAYLKHGSYTSALKAFNKVLEIDSEMLYSAYQLANIKLILGLHKEAVQLFNKLILKVPSYVPALKGLGEAYLYQARFYLQQSEPLRVLSFCQLAIKPISSALVESPSLICLWKLLGDVCTAIGPLPQEIVSMSVPSSILKGVPRNNSDFVELNKAEILTLGARAYSLTCDKTLHSSLTWHDLAVNYYFQYKGLTHDRLPTLNKAAVFAKRAVNLNQNNAVHWNVLGIIAMAPEIRNYRLAQHCFIKSVTVEPKNSVAWSNLGSFYLLNSNIDLAHKALTISQSLEPSYPNSWIGLAVCAELVGHDDTIDLFRHCTTLSNHAESCIGYGSWVCNSLLDNQQSVNEFDYHIREMNAIPAAVDCITRYINMTEIKSACAYNIDGLLLEREGLLNSAAASFEMSLQLISKDENCNFDSVASNIARIYRKLKNYDKSCDLAKTIEKKQFFSLCDLAFDYYHQGNLQEMGQSFEQAFNMADSDLEKAHLLVALASVAYSVQGPEEAKTLLFKSCEEKPDCLQTLMALSALSILEGDLSVLNATIDELSKFQQDENAMIHVSYLQSCQAVLQGDFRKGRNFICKVVHKWPGNFHFWKLLSRYILQHDSSSLNLVVKCAQISSTLCSKPSLQVLQLLCLSYYATGQSKQALSAAKKLIHCYPDESLNWKIKDDLIKL